MPSQPAKAGRKKEEEAFFSKSDLESAQEELLLANCSGSLFVFVELSKGGPNAANARDSGSFQKMGVKIDGKSKSRCVIQNLYYFSITTSPLAASIQRTYLLLPSVHLSLAGLARLLAML